jgi:hypothetical protein
MEPLILTVNGRRINPLHLTPEDVYIEDVAHHLAIINRFNGATLFPLSVAQHAVHVSLLLEGTGLEEQGLHHDDAEFALGCVTKWLKETPEMTSFREAETRAQRSCYTAFSILPVDYEGYPHLMHPLVSAADRLMLRFEGRAGFGEKIWNDWLAYMNNPLYTPITKEEIKLIGDWAPCDWVSAEAMYLDRYNQLVNRHMI